jgi:hypothetical protein
MPNWRDRPPLISSTARTSPSDEDTRSEYGSVRSAMLSTRPVSSMKIMSSAIIVLRIQKFAWCGGS